MNRICGICLPRVEIEEFHSVEKHNRSKMQFHSIKFNEQLLHPNTIYTNTGKESVLHKIETLN